MSLSSKLNLDITPVDFFERLFQIRDVLHSTHLYQPDKSFASHAALDEAYTNMLPIIDGIIEAYFGLHGPRKLNFKSASSNNNILAYVQGEYAWIESSRHMFKETWMHNEIDNILFILAKLIYKLKYVK